MGGYPGSENDSGTSPSIVNVAIGLLWLFLVVVGAVKLLFG